MSLNHSLYKYSMKSAEDIKSKCRFQLYAKGNKKKTAFIIFQTQKVVMVGQDPPKSLNPLTESIMRVYACP